MTCTTDCLTPSRPSVKVLLKVNTILFAVEIGLILLQDTFEASGSGLFFKGILGFKEEKLGRPQDAKLGPNDVVSSP